MVRFILNGAFWLAVLNRMADACVFVLGVAVGLAVAVFALWVCCVIGAGLGSLVGPDPGVSSAVGAVLFGVPLLRCAVVFWQSMGAENGQ